MKQLRNLTAVITAAALIAIVTGCTPATVANKPTSSSTSKASGAVKSYGDVIVLKKVTDEFGTYQQTTIDPKSAVAVYDPSTLDLSAGDQGFTPKQLQSALTYVLKFVTEEGVDSIALDRNMAGWDQWKTQEGSKFVLEGERSNILNTASPGYDRPSLISSDFNNKFPVFIRDGKPRLTESHPTVQKITEGTAAHAGRYVYFTGSTTTTYRLDNKAMQAVVVLDDPTKDLATLKATRPEYFDGSENTFDEVWSWQYAVIPEGDGWMIGGYYTGGKVSFKN
jgi:hypothetical protein